MALRTKCSHHKKQQKRQTRPTPDNECKNRNSQSHEAADYHDTCRTQKSGTPETEDPSPNPTPKIQRLKPKTQIQRLKPEPEIQNPNPRLTPKNRMRMNSLRRRLLQNGGQRHRERLMCNLFRRSGASRSHSRLLGSPRRSLCSPLRILIKIVFVGRHL